MANKLVALRLGVVVLLLQAAVVDAAGADFFTKSSRECQQECINEQNHFFLTPDNTEGRCCDLRTHSLESCLMGGSSTLDIRFGFRGNGAESLLCPQEDFCKQRLNVAKKEADSIHVDSLAWTDLQICNYKFTFSIDAGRSDILKVNFKTLKNGFIRYFVGTSLSDVKGTTLTRAEGKTIRVAYPFSLYVSVQHSKEGTPAQLSLEYFYKDQDPDSPEETLESMFDIQEVTRHEREADLTFLYIIGPLILVQAILFGVYFGRKWCIQQRLHRQVLEQRKNGLYRSWGVRRTPLNYSSSAAVGQSQHGIQSIELEDSQLEHDYSTRKMIQANRADLKVMMADPIELPGPAKFQTIQEEEQENNATEESIQGIQKQMNSSENTARIAANLNALKGRSLVEQADFDDSEKDSKKQDGFHFD